MSHHREASSCIHNIPQQIRQRGRLSKSSVQGYRFIRIINCVDPFTCSGPSGLVHFYIWLFGRSGSIQDSTLPSPYRLHGLSHRLFEVLFLSVQYKLVCVNWFSRLHGQHVAYLKDLCVCFLQVEPFRSITSHLCYADDSQFELLIKSSEHNKHAKLNSDNTLVPLPQIWRALLKTWKLLLTAS